MAVRKSQLIGLGGLFLMSATSAQSCDYSRNAMCIKAEASASVVLPFAPLFSTAPTFVFAIDNMEDQDIQDMLTKDKDLSPPAAKAPAQAVSWWFEYGNGTDNKDQHQDRVYFAWALESNSTNDIGGNDGGCENLLGAECVRNLKALFTSLGAESFLENLAGFFRTPPSRINCPTLLWHRGDGKIPTLWESAFARPLWEGGQWFARMSTFHEWTTEAPPSGNASSTHGVRQMRYRSFEEQKATAVIALNMGLSLVGGGRDNATINMACLRVGEAPKPGTGASPSDTKNNAARARTTTTSAVVLGAMAAVWGFVA